MWLSGYNVSLNEYPSLRDSLRFEFGEAETTLVLTWDSGNTMTVVWGEEDRTDGSSHDFFYLRTQSGAQPNTTTETRRAFPRLGIVPMLTPVEHTEELLNDEYVRRNSSGRLASRHFRNQLRVLRSDEGLDGLLAFAAPWVPNLGFDGLSSHDTPNGRVVDLFLRERGSRIPKEIIWAGDGIQVWLQLMRVIQAGLFVISPERAGK